ncbi:MAG: MlaE family lipid ABC transporter permease subunit [Desulfovibrionales bacterium]|nr:MlaE family lipid ABC transporter permease subunit [Desulfovibrionales bacterium]
MHKHLTSAPSRPALQVTHQEQQTLVSLHGEFTLHSTPAILPHISSQLQTIGANGLVADLGQVTRMDDCGALVVLALERAAQAQKRTFTLRDIPDHVRELFTFLRLDESITPAVTKPDTPNVLARFGEKTLYVMDQAMQHISFVGELTVTICSIFRHPTQLRWSDTLRYMQSVGVDALPIVALISFLLGLIMAFMSAVQLQQFGANIYVASLVALAMVRELGPIMTAILVAGRSGSAFAAEIGTMKVSEEVDALITMGFHPTLFLVAPKVIASVLVVPFLALFSNFFAIGGGLLIGISALDLTTHSYMVQTMNTLTVFDIAWGMFKSALFALLIAAVGCFKGYQVRGGAASVGQATTSAVVSGIFLIILADSILAVVLRYWR